MFQLSLVDHLRLTFGHVVYRHRAHSQLALTLSKWSRRLRAGEVVLMIRALTGVPALDLSRQ